MYHLALVVGFAFLKDAFDSVLEALKHRDDKLELHSTLDKQNIRVDAPTSTYTPLHNFETTCVQTISMS